jgi:hypothetical protein
MAIICLKHSHQKLSREDIMREICSNIAKAHSEVAGQTCLRTEKKLFNGHQFTNFNNGYSALKKVCITSLFIAGMVYLFKSLNKNDHPKIDEIDCGFQNSNQLIHDFENYRKNAGSFFAKATDQYCLARMYESGLGTEVSLREARNWYKHAADQGLTAAKNALCQPKMFPEEEVNFDEFAALCCPSEGPLNLPKCPWIHIT